MSIEDANTSRPANLLLYWWIVKRAKLMVGLITILFAALGVLLALVLQPIYESKVVLVQSEQDNAQSSLMGLASQFGGLASLTGLSFGSGNQDKVRALATLKSRGFVTSFIEEKDLLPVLFDGIWVESTKSWDVEEADEVPTLHDAYETFVNTVYSVADDPATGIVEVVVHWKDPVVAAEWANEMVAKVNNDLRSVAIADATRSIEYLNRELEKTSVVGVQQGIYRLIESQVSTIMLAETQAEYAFKVVDNAVPADPDRFVSPKRFQIVFLFTVFGFGFAAFIAIWRDYVRRVRENSVSAVAG